MMNQETFKVQIQVTYREHIQTKHFPFHSKMSHMYLDRVNFFFSGLHCHPDKVDAGFSVSVRIPSVHFPMLFFSSVEDDDAMFSCMYVTCFARFFVDSRFYAWKRRKQTYGGNILLYFLNFFPLELHFSSSPNL